ncbi:MAG: DNA-3-methyladenine glycosylase I [Deltaproteobacteria bacterium]|uniref:DNA-3-methyladenine glycosylase I n=1 Tax=Candidatus Zymogenus saltonus TaxID=2844893 RepID=A0A9D8PQ80_9DELT|nr:DNA-3-methyladenine glycosylase I [Candidatus Zymogenus saltonus]
MNRCPWAGSDLMIRYHDTEWGVFTLDDIAQFEHLSLEVFQAGLSWETILKKRETLRRLFADFDPEIVARFDEARVQEILKDRGGIRNERKIRAVINNAVRILEIREKQGGPFGRFLFESFGGEVKINSFKKMEELPPKTAVSEYLSIKLKKLGFNFVGPTTIYAHLQAVGFVNDHIVDCFRWREVQAVYPK